MLVFGANSFATPTITNTHAGETDFLIQSNAGNATIVNQTGGVTIFDDFELGDEREHHQQGERRQYLVLRHQFGR